VKEKDDNKLNLAALAKEYSSERKARALFEKMRWPDGAYCPHCAAQGSDCKDVYRIKTKGTRTHKKREGLWACGACRQQFSVTVGTVLEGSHIPIHKWLLAMFLMCSAKKGISAHQMHRTLKVSYKTAWFLCHRIRFAMNEGGLATMLQGAIEGDEMYVGPHTSHKFAQASKVALAALIERDGKARTQVFKSVTEKNIRQFVSDTVVKGSTIHSDEHAAYKKLKRDDYKHFSVNHSAFQYARKLPGGQVSHVNTCESFFSLMRRGIIGSFHHVSTHHLHRYADEFSFRWNNRKITDSERLEIAVEQVVGKRLTFHQCA
jgi:transposase-like protein